jgi:hypothetical protein
MLVVAAVVHMELVVEVQVVLVVLVVAVVAAGLVLL